MLRLPHALLLAALAALTACDAGPVVGDGPVGTETRPVGEFTQLELSGPFTVTWTSGAPKLAVEAESNVLPKVKVSMLGDKLRVETDGLLIPKRTVRLALSSARLSLLSAEGALDMDARGLSGASLGVSCFGAAKLRLDGRVERLSVKMEGAGEFSATNLAVKFAEVNLQGAGRADLRVSQTMKVFVAGAGKVRYLGAPVVEQKLYGAGSLEQVK